MRRRVFVAAIVFVLAVLPGFAQRMGARGGAMRGGAGIGMRMGPGPGRPSFGGFSQNHFGGTFHSGFHHGCPNCSHFHPHHGHFPRWSFAYGYPFYGYGLGYSYSWPAWDWDSSYSQWDDRSYETERALMRQIDDLQQEMQRLREEQAEQTYEAEHPHPERSSEPPGPAPAAAESRKDLPTILVYRDQHIQEVQNYAIVGKDMVVVGDRRSTKIPLERLDLAATAKLNDERGVDFQLPR